MKLHRGFVADGTVWSRGDRSVGAHLDEIDGINDGICNAVGRKIQDIMDIVSLEWISSGHQSIVRRYSPTHWEQRVRMMSWWADYFDRLKDAGAVAALLKRSA
jgi:hypothetical protein